MTESAAEKVGVSYSNEGSLKETLLSKNKVSQALLAQDETSRLSINQIGEYSGQHLYQLDEKTIIGCRGYLLEE